MAKKGSVSVQVTVNYKYVKTGNETVDQKIEAAIVKEVKAAAKESLTAFGLDVKASKKDGGPVSQDINGKVVEVDYSTDE